MVTRGIVELPPEAREVIMITEEEEVEMGYQYLMAHVMYRCNPKTCGLCAIERG